MTQSEFFSYCLGLLSSLGVLATLQMAITAMLVIGVVSWILKKLSG